MTFDGISEATLQAIDEFVTCVDDFLRSTTCVWLQGDDKRFNSLDDRASSQVFQYPVVERSSRPLVGLDVHDILLRRFAADEQKPFISIDINFDLGIIPVHFSEFLWHAL